MKKNKIKKNITLIFIIGAVFSFTLFYVNLAEYNDNSSYSFSGKEVTVYKSPTCGCCEGHVEAYENAGFKVNTVDTQELADIKHEHNIPMHARSCHTAIIDEYFVEGHVPMKAIDELLENKPDIDGIALPGMPSGTPGMPGPKIQDYEILSVKEGKTEDFMII